MKLKKPSYKRNYLSYDLMLDLTTCLQRLVRCWVANQNSPPPSHRGSFGGTRTQATGGECKTKNVLRRWRFGPSHLLLLFGRSLQFSRLARIPRVDYKRKPT